MLCTVPNARWDGMAANATLPWLDTVPNHAAGKRAMLPTVEYYGLLYTKKMHTNSYGYTQRASWKSRVSGWGLTTPAWAPQ